MVRVNKDILEKLDELVDSGVNSSRSEAAAFMIGEGMKFKTDLFEKIAEKTEIIQNALNVADSISQTISIENSWTISDIIVDPSQAQPHVSLEKKIQVEMIQDLLGHLDEREIKILRMRYGLDNGEPMTLKEIGQRVNLSRERVRQIENDALGKLQELVAEGQIKQPEIYDEQLEESMG